MTRHETVRPMTDGQRADIIATLVQAIPPSLSFEDAKSITGQKGAFINGLRTVFRKYSPQWDAKKLLTEWYLFYGEQFGLYLDFDNLVIPERREGFDRLIVVVQGVTIEQVFDKCGQKFHTWKHTDGDLDGIYVFNQRDTKSGHYAIWVRDRVETDEEWKNYSANQLEHIEMKGETLLERLLHGLQYYLETGIHLDTESITICSGSRDSEGRVPGVYWNSAKTELRIRWASPLGEHGDLRPREVVAL